MKMSLKAAALATTILAAGAVADASADDRAAGNVPGALLAQASGGSGTSGSTATPKPSGTMGAVPGDPAGTRKQGGEASGGSGHDSDARSGRAGTGMTNDPAAGSASPQTGERQANPTRQGLPGTGSSAAPVTGTGTGKMDTGTSAPGTGLRSEGTDQQGGDVRNDGGN